MLQLGLDAIAQFAQIMERQTGHSIGRTEWDKNLTRSAAITGAIGGALGPVLAGLGHYPTKALGHALGGILGKNAGHEAGHWAADTIKGATHEWLTDGMSGAAQHQGWNPDPFSTTAGALDEGISGAAGLGGRKGGHRYYRGMLGGGMEATPQIRIPDQLLLRKNQVADGYSLPGKDSAADRKPLEPVLLSELVRFPEPVPVGWPSPAAEGERARSMAGPMPGIGHEWVAAVMARMSSRQGDGAAAPGVPVAQAWAMRSRPAPAITVIVDPGQAEGEAGRRRTGVVEEQALQEATAAGRRRRGVGGWMARQLRGVGAALLHPGRSRRSGDGAGTSASAAEDAQRQRRPMLAPPPPAQAQAPTTNPPPGRVRPATPVPTRPTPVVRQGTVAPTRSTAAVPAELPATAAPTRVATPAPERPATPVPTRPTPVVRQGTVAPPRPAPAVPAVHPAPTRPTPVVRQGTVAPTRSTATVPAELPAATAPTRVAAPAPTRPAPAVPAVHPAAAVPVRVAADAAPSDQPAAAVSRWQEPIRSHSVPGTTRVVAPAPVQVVPGAAALAHGAAATGPGEPSGPARVESRPVTVTETPEVLALAHRIAAPFAGSYPAAVTGLSRAMEAVGIRVLDDRPLVHGEPGVPIDVGLDAAAGAALRWAERHARDQAGTGGELGPAAVSGVVTRRMVLALREAWAVHPAGGRAVTPYAGATGWGGRGPDMRALAEGERGGRPSWWEGFADLVAGISTGDRAAAAVQEAARQGRPVLGREWVLADPGAAASTSSRFPAEVEELIVQAEQSPLTGDRVAAIEALVGWLGDPRLRSWLQLRAESDPAPVARLSLALLGSVEWRGDPQFGTWLRSRAVEDTNAEVRQSLVWHLANRSAEPDLAGWLQERAHRDPDAGIRETAARALEGLRDSLLLDRSVPGQAPVPEADVPVRSASRQSSGSSAGDWQTAGTSSLSGDSAVEADAVVVGEPQRRADAVVAEPQRPVEVVVAEPQRRAEAVVAEPQRRAEAVVVGEPQRRADAVVAEPQPQPAPVAQAARPAAYEPSAERLAEIAFLGEAAEAVYAAHTLLRLLRGEGMPRAALRDVDVQLAGYLIRDLHMARDVVEDVFRRAGLVERWLIALTDAVEALGNRNFRSTQGRPQGPWIVFSAGLDDALSGIVRWADHRSRTNPSPPAVGGRRHPEAEAEAQRTRDMVLSLGNAVTLYFVRLRNAAGSVLGAGVSAQRLQQAENSLIERPAWWQSFGELVAAIRLGEIPATEVVLAARQRRPLYLRDWVFAAAGWVPPAEALRFPAALIPTLQWQAETDVGPEYRAEAISRLGLWAGDPAIRDWLRERVTSDPDPGVRLSAVQLLVRDWGISPEMALWLQGPASTDTDVKVRSAAIQGMGRSAGDPRVRAWLQNHGTFSHLGVMRRACLVAAAWSTAPELVNWVRDRAVNDPDTQVRRTAMDVMGAHLKNPDLSATAQDVLRWLQGRAVADDDVHVRSAAIRGIAAFGITDEGTRTWLLDQVPGSRHPRVGWEVMNAVARELPGGQEQLRQWAVADPSPEVRIAALEIVALWWGTDLAVHHWLLERGTRDADQQVRDAALLALGVQQDPRSYYAQQWLNVREESGANMSLRLNRVTPARPDTVTLVDVGDARVHTVRRWFMGADGKAVPATWARRFGSWGLIRRGQRGAEGGTRRAPVPISWGWGVVKGTALPPGEDEWRRRRQRMLAAAGTVVRVGERVPDRLP
ncbi:MAG TPA: hypothetical protein VFP72_02840 [Kineosporiaceae bacterium]|nr:hypothetical protein [Kineosporiaceae bacterium]